MRKGDVDKEVKVMGDRLRGALKEMGKAESRNNNRKIRIVG